MTTEKKRKFRGECKLFVANLLLKLQERVPIQYALIRSSSSINPNNMAIQAAHMSKKFVRLVDLLYSLKFISYFVADNVKFQYDLCTKKEMINEKDQFLSFDMRKQQSDVFLLDCLNINPQYKELGAYVNLYLSYNMDRVLRKKASALTRK